MSLESCQSCGSINLHSDNSTGQVVCTNCGQIASNIIESALQFTENTLAGKIINLQTKSIYSTINKTEQLINNILKLCYLPTSYTQTVHRFYKLCSQYKLTRGKKLLYTLSAVVYLVCRLENVGILIIDISSTMRLDCFYVAKMFVNVQRALKVKVSHVDPSFYLQKYVHSLVEKCWNDDIHGGLFIQQNPVSKNVTKESQFSYNMIPVRRNSLEYNLGIDRNESEYFKNFHQTSEKPTFHDQKPTKKTYESDNSIYSDSHGEICDLADEKTSIFQKNHMNQLTGAHHILKNTPKDSPIYESHIKHCMNDPQSTPLYNLSEADADLSYKQPTQNLCHQNSHNQTDIYITKDSFVSELCLISLHIIKYMQRDWIITGRRPNNVCGAAILLASRILFRKYAVKDIIKREYKSENDQFLDSLINKSNQHLHKESNRKKNSQSSDCKSGRVVKRYTELYSSDHGFDERLKQESSYKPRNNTDLKIRFQEIFEIEHTKKEKYFDNNYHDQIDFSRHKTLQHQEDTTCGDSIKANSMLSRKLPNHIKDNMAKYLNSSIFRQDHDSSDTSPNFQYRDINSKIMPIHLHDKVENSLVPLFDIQDISKSIKGSVVTIQQRLDEINDTKTAEMDIETFLVKYMDQEEDPPVLKKQKLKQLKELQQREARKKQKRTLISLANNEDLKTKDSSKSKKTNKKREKNQIEQNKDEDLELSASQNDKQTNKRSSLKKLNTSNTDFNICHDRNIVHESEVCNNNNPENTFSSDFSTTHDFICFDKELDSDSEINNILCTSDQIKEREIIWNEMFADYVKERETAAKIIKTPSERKKRVISKISQPKKSSKLDYDAIDRFFGL